MPIELEINEKTRSTLARRVLLLLGAKVAGWSDLTISFGTGSSTALSYSVNADYIAQ